MKGLIFVILLLINSKFLLGQDLYFDEPISSDIMCKGCSDMPSRQFAAESKKITELYLKNEYSGLLDSLIFKKFPSPTYDLKSMIDGNRTKWGSSSDFSIPEVKVCFILTKPQIDERKMNLLNIETTAKQWAAVAGVSFKFNFNVPCSKNALRNEADIRITFSHPDYDGWSLIGNQGRERDGATMILRNLDTSPFSTRSKRIILHEFGHALGMLHEHQHPAFLCKFDQEKLRKKYSDDIIKKNFLPLELAPGMKVTTFDAKSIMLYEFSPNDFEVGCLQKFPANSEISAQDIEAIRFFYPRTLTEFFENKLRHKQNLASLEKAIEILSERGQYGFLDIKSQIKSRQNLNDNDIKKIESLNPSRFNSKIR